MMQDSTDISAIAPAAVVDALKLVAVFPDPHTGHVVGVSEHGEVYGFNINLDGSVDWENEVVAEFLCPSLHRMLCFMGFRGCLDHLTVEHECNDSCLDGSLWDDPFRNAHY